MKKELLNMRKRVKINMDFLKRIGRWVQRPKNIATLVLMSVGTGYIVVKLKFLSPKYVAITVFMTALQA